MAQPPSCPFGAIHLEDRRGTRTYQALQYFRCARSEWLPAFYSGPLGPSSSRISYPSLRPDGQSSLTPSLHLRAKSRRFAAVALRSARLRASVLPNANSLRWALRWGPPSAADWIGKLGAVWFHSCAWLGRAIAPGANPAGRSGTGPYEESVTTSASSVGAAHTGADEGAEFVLFCRGGAPGPPAVETSAALRLPACYFTTTFSSPRRSFRSCTRAGWIIQRVPTRFLQSSK